MKIAKSCTTWGCINFVHSGINCIVTGQPGFFQQSRQGCFPENLDHFPNHPISQEDGSESRLGGSLWMEKTNGLQADIFYWKLKTWAFLKWRWVVFRSEMFPFWWESLKEMWHSQPRRTKDLGSPKFVFLSFMGSKSDLHSDHVFRPGLFNLQLHSL